MPVNYDGLKQLLENCRARGNADEYTDKLKGLLGLREERGMAVIDRNREFRPEEFSLKGLAQKLVGEDFYESCGQTGSNASSMRLMEDGSTGISPTAFSNINAFNATTGLLIQVKVLEGYRRPEFIADKLARTIPTQQRAQKIIGTSMLGDWVQNMNANDPHPRAQFGERFVTTPTTQKRGLAIDVTKEAVFFDLTNEVLTRADSVGQAIGLRKEFLMLDTVLGISNTYSYRGTGYNTYLTSGNWINVVSGNQLVDWTSLRTASLLLTNMTDQETGQRISVTARDLLVMPYRKWDAKRIIHATQIVTADNQANAYTQRTFADNPVGGDFNEPLVSPYAYQRLTDANGGNHSASAAQEYFFLGDFQMAFAYMQNWDMQVLRADPNNYNMIDQGLIFSVFANEMGIPAVMEPRAIVKSYNT